jgi:Xaa-Pro aminopeptidase
VTHTSELQIRRALLWAALRTERVDAFLVTALPNIRYLAGFTGSNAALLMTEDRALLFTDPRYQTQTLLESDCEVKVAKGPLLAQAVAWAKRLRATQLGFERNRISFDQHQVLLKERTTKDRPSLRLKPVASAVERLRMVKSETEIATIRTAVRLNSEAFEQAVAHFKPGVTEIDLAAEIEYRMRRLGADGPSFDTIVASGPRTALPHAHPTDAPVSGDELLLIDMGATVAGYASDMTRTLAVGELSRKARRMYHAVWESQLAAIEAVKPGVTCHTVDRAARRVLAGYGFEKLFIHSTGHGLGLEIHEGPRIGRRDATVLETGMVITIEPGVYLEGFGGVRIEDTVAVTANGCEILTPTVKELRVL